MVQGVGTNLAGPADLRFLWEIDCWVLLLLATRGTRRPPTVMYLLQLAPKPT